MQSAAWFWRRPRCPRCRARTTVLLRRRGVPWVVRCPRCGLYGENRH